MQLNSLALESRVLSKSTSDIVTDISSLTDEQLIQIPFFGDSKFSDTDNSNLIN